MRDQPPMIRSPRRRASTVGDAVSQMLPQWGLRSPTQHIGLLQLRPTMSASGQKQKSAARLAMSALPRKRTWEARTVMSAKGHVWTAPGWQEESSLCSIGQSSHVFGLFCAVHMTAGHNALRGSGPGQKHAFEDAMALVGCPDRRIDRRCIKCCSPSQPLRHTGYPV